MTNAPAVTTSTNPTAPAVHKVATRTHSRTTRNNTPGAVPAIVNPDQVVGLGLPPARRSRRLLNAPPPWRSPSSPLIARGRRIEFHYFIPAPASSHKTPSTYSPAKSTTKMTPMHGSPHPSSSQAQQRSAATTTSTLSTSAHPSSTQLPAKQSRNTANLSRIQSPTKYGQQHLERNGAAWPKATTKLAKREQTPSLS